jgi:hypothetical protein
MTIKLYQDLIKTDEQTWNERSPQGETDQYFVDWKTNVVEKQPGYISMTTREDLDANTRRITWEIDTIDHAKPFYQATHDPSNPIYKAYIDNVMSMPTYQHHKFRLSLDRNDGSNNAVTVMVEPK